MKTRYKSPGGTGVLELSDEVTVQALFEEIRRKTGIRDFIVKYGPPMAMQTLDFSQRDAIAKSLGLHGETLTVVPNEALIDESPQTASQVRHPGPRDSNQVHPNTDPQDIVVPWPQREGTLLLRVMPSDNSCLFTAFGGALPEQIRPSRLRQMMADYILAHPDEYTEAVLGSSPQQYCRSITDPDRWGGGIELSILSSIFDIQICTYDVQGKNLIAFGEDKSQRCILVYSGIHYDRVAFSLSEYPFNKPTLPPETDRTLWPTDDEQVLTMSEKLVQKLHNAHYFTDMDGLILKCDVPGCGWIGSGEVEGKKHAEKTGHVDLSEVQDIEGDNMLRTCSAPGCDFMGVGDKAIRQHTTDSGHVKFSIIPDS